MCTQIEFCSVVCPRLGPTPKPKLSSQGHLWQLVICLAPFARGCRVADNWLKTTELGTIVGDNIPSMQLKFRVTWGFPNV